MAQKLRMAVVGVGGMGGKHAELITQNPKVELVGVCDLDKAKADTCAAKHKTKPWYSHQELFENEKLDAITIGTPHYDHPVIAKAAFAKGLHVLSEKPLGVTAASVQAALSAWRQARTQRPGLVYGVMFQERTFPHYRKLKELVVSGVLGRLVRATWVHTQWFRSQWYYDHGDWRATWKGEGGGVLLNQCPHTLDMFQWLVGVPQRVSGQVSLGKYHDIEVEDEATALFQYDSGLLGHFHTSTAESPGTNRLELVGEHGKLVFEEGKLRHWRNKVSMLKHLKESKDGFKPAEHEVCEVPLPSDEGPYRAHAKVLDSFYDAITLGTPLVATAEEGLNSIAMSNAIMLSSFTGSVVEVFGDPQAFELKLRGLVDSSRFQKKVSGGSLDFEGSWKT